MRFDTILDAIGNTPLVGIPTLSPKPKVHFWAKLEGHNPTGSVKDRIALRMVLEAEESGMILPDSVVLEPTSGNTGIGLAMVCKRRGHRLVCVMPADMSIERRQLLEIYGADLVLSPAGQGSNGAISLAKEMLADPKYVMLYQYGNDANWRAHYDGTGAEIVRDLPEVDVFVAGLGTSGTLMGCGRRIKEHNPKAKIVAAEPDFGDAIQGLRSLQEGFIPPILDESVLDCRIQVTSRDAVRAVRDLLEREGIFAGISSGAAIYAAQRVALDMDRGNVAIVLPDGGLKYLSTGSYVGGFEEAAEDLEKTVLG